MKPVRIVLLFFVGLLAPGLWAQDSAAYVSRLAAQAGTQSVLLTWKDAEGWADARYEIWRSDKEIVKDSLSSAKLVDTVAPGVEAYEDTTVTSPSFYLVLLKDAQGNRKGYYIPYRNKTTVAVAPDGAAPALTARIKVGAVTYASPQVLVPFQAFPPDRKLVVFRRTTPITSLADLKDATLLGNTTGAQSPWKDTPAPGLEFYYAVLDAQAFSNGKADSFQDENATETPAGFPLVAATEVTQTPALDASLRPNLDQGPRALPLPRLEISSEPGSGSPLVSAAFTPVARQPLSPGATSVLRQWAKTSSRTEAELPPTVVLPEERSAAQTGAGRYLVQIQKAYLEPKDWKGAVAALETVLKLTLDARTEARARFYLAEAYAYQKDYRRAFVSFLDARELYPEETEPFLEALFTLLPKVSG